MSEPTVLAVDAGNSKTDMLLVDIEGRVLATARGPGACHQKIGLWRVLDVIEGLAEQAAALAGSSGGPPFATHTAAYLAGADLPREEEMLRRAIVERGWSASSAVGNDTFALLRTGTTDNVGVAVVCGTGINCVGVARDGRVHRFPALGRISGDWGGGDYLGSEALWWAVRAEDGRGPKTALLPAILNHFTVPSTAKLIEALHFGEIPESAVYELSPLLFQVAGAGDVVAGSVVSRLVEEITVLATVSLHRLGLLEEPASVVLGGGVLVGAGEALVREVERRCTAVAPQCQVALVEVPPVVGAALLGLDALSAPPPTETRLRAAYLTCRRSTAGASRPAAGSSSGGERRLDRRLAGVEGSQSHTTVRSTLTGVPADSLGHQQPIRDDQR